MVPRAPNQYTAEFLLEIGLTLEQAAGRTDDIPVAPVVAVPYKLRKPFVTEEGEISLGTEIYIDILQAHRITAVAFHLGVF